MKKADLKATMHSRLENRTIELVKRTQQRINMTLRTHVVSGNTNHPITINHKVERITPS